MITRKKVPEIVIGAKTRTKADNFDFTSMFVGSRPWRNGLEIAENINIKKAKNRQYFRDKKGAKRSLKTPE